jgi:hypothetical protein
MSDHYTRAQEIIASIEADGALPPSLLIKVAEVHAVLALAEEVVEWRQQELEREARHVERIQRMMNEDDQRG